MKKVITGILLLSLFFAGCASLQQRTFNSSNFDSMNKIAFLVISPKTRQWNSTWKLTEQYYELPVVWRNTPRSTNPTFFLPATAITNAGIITITSASGVFRQVAVYNDDTEKLHQFVKDIDFDLRVREAIIDRLTSVKPFQFLPFEKIENIYDRSPPDYDTLIEQARSTGFSAKEKKEAERKAIGKAESAFLDRLSPELMALGADTFFLVKIDIWGFESLPFLPTREGNFSSAVNVSIFRLVDKEKTWQNTVSVNLSGERGREPLDKFLVNDRQKLLESVDVLANSIGSLIVNRLTGSDQNEQRQDRDRQGTALHNFNW